MISAANVILASRFKKKQDDFLYLNGRFLLTGKKQAGQYSGDTHYLNRPVDNMDCHENDAEDKPDDPDQEYDFSLGGHKGQDDKRHCLENDPDPEIRKERIKYGFRSGKAGQEG